MPDIFLSYSRADNSFPKGWVKQFHESLETITRVTAGKRKFTVWLDEEDRVGINLDDSIRKALDESTFLLTIISPLYFEDDSGWCTRERDYFVTHVARDSDRAKKRIITALKLFDESEDEVQLPQVLRNQFRYKLYKVDNNIPYPLEPTDPEWTKSILAIAHSIKKELKNLTQEVQPDQRHIFLALSKNLYEEQLKLKAELEALGAQVKTLMPNLKKPEAWKAEFQKALENCEMSIHLFGPTYETKSDINCSLEEQQWRWAIENAAHSNLKVVSWIDPEIKNIEELQQKLINFIRTDDNLPAGHDFLEKSFEELIGTIQESMNATP